MQVTDPRGWLVLAAFGVVLSAGAVWGVLGRLPHDVGGVGMLVKSGGVFEVIASSAGRITDVAVQVGEMVTEGQVVARIAQPERADRLAEAKAVLAVLRTQRDEIVAHGSQDVALQTRLLGQQRTTVEQAMSAVQQSTAWYEEKIRIQEKLVEEGLLTKQTLLNTRQQLEGASQRISEGRGQLAQIAVQELDLRNRRHEEVRAVETKIDAQERAVAELERDVKGHTEIVAQHTGRIVEIITEQGAVVAS